MIKRYIEELNQRNFTILDEVVADEVLLESDIITRDQYRQLIKDRIDEFPDYFVKIKRLETRDDVVILYWQRFGTSRKTGKKLNEELVSEYRILGGKIVEVY